MGITKMVLERLLGRVDHKDCQRKIEWADTTLQVTKVDSSYNNQGIGALSKIRGNARSTRKRPFTTRGLPIHKRRRKQHI